MNAFWCMSMIDQSFPALNSSPLYIRLRGSHPFCRKNCAFSGYECFVLLFLHRHCSFSAFNGQGFSSILGSPALTFAFLRLSRLKTMMLRQGCRLNEILSQSPMPGISMDAVGSRSFPSFLSFFSFGLPFLSNKT